MVVQVLDPSFPQTSLVGLVGTERRLNLNSLYQDGISLEVDPSVNAWYKTSEGEVAFVLPNASQPQFVNIRCGAQGPILGTLTLQSMQVFGAGRTWFHIVDTLEDGTDKMSMGMISFPVLDDVTVQFNVFLPGVTLDDGTRYRKFHTEDYDNMDHSVEMILLKTPAAPKTAACHHIDVYQNGLFVGRAY